MLNKTRIPDWSDHQLDLASIGPPSSKQEYHRWGSSFVPKWATFQVRAEHKAVARASAHFPTYDAISPCVWPWAPQYAWGILFTFGLYFLSIAVWQLHSSSYQRKASPKWPRFERCECTCIFYVWVITKGLSGTLFRDITKPRFAKNTVL